MSQLDFLNALEGKPIIETVMINPTKEMPLEVFREFHHFAYFAETMERTLDGKVIWDKNATSIVDKNLADVEYTALQNDWLQISMEVPREWVE